MTLGSTFHRILGTGRARSRSSHRCPESMFKSCFRNFTPLLILWQLFLGCSAPWLHTVTVGTCAASTGHKRLQNTCAPESPLTKKPGRSCGCGFQHRSEKPLENSAGDGPPEKPHDCSNCQVCQAIAAPRTLVTIVEVEACEYFFLSLDVAECADPMLGFGLPPQCRAPPRS